MSRTGIEKDRFYPYPPSVAAGEGALKVIRSAEKVGCFSTVGKYR